MNRGYGVSALINPDFIAPLASAAESAGYSTFWVNDVEAASGLEQLARAQAATATIALGVGVLPVDRWTPAQVEQTCQSLALDPSRLIIGIGAGPLHKGSLAAVKSCATDLRARDLGQVVVGALGPKMCALAGSDADGVLLNWLTPDSAAELGQITRNASSASPTIRAYIRTAASVEASQRLQRECAAYESYPSYARHFARMGVTAMDTCILGNAISINERFEGYAGCDEVVARAIVGEESTAAYLEVLNAAAPLPVR